MSVTTAKPLMTAEEFEALPEVPGLERLLIRGQLLEFPKDAEMTRRNHYHGRIEARIAQLLGMWLDTQPEPRGELYSGEIGCYLRRNPDTSVGIDVAYFSSEVVAHQVGSTTMLEGVPILAVEVLSPSDTIQEIDAKVEEYLKNGVKLVWLINAHFETVEAHRTDGPPQLFHAPQDLIGEPHLPGFCVPVAKVFSRSKP